MTAKGCVLAVLCLLSFLGCAQSNPLEQKYGSDALYFRALLESKAGNDKLCVRLLNEAQNKSSPLVSRRAMEQLARSPNLQDRIEKKVEIYKRFGDEDSLLQAVVELFGANEFQRIIEMTEGIELATCSNEIAFYRIQALGKTTDERFEGELFDWALARPFSSFHYKLYCDLAAFPAVHEEKLKLLEMRADVFAKNYSKAYIEAKAILADDKFFIPQILNDAGKALLYGSPNLQTNAMWLDSIKDALPEDCKFYASFYAGRLYDKQDANRARAQNRFQSALEETQDDKNFDSALWHYLNSLLKTSIFRTTAAVEKYSRMWSEPSYFDDFFETLLLRLLSLHAWQELLRVTDLIEGNASLEVQAKYAFITARLIEEKFIRLSAHEAKTKTQALYKRALQSGSDLYYRFQAMSKLDLTNEQIERIVCAGGKQSAVGKAADTSGTQTEDELVHSDSAAREAEETTASEDEAARISEVGAQDADASGSTHEAQEAGKGSTGERSVDKGESTQEGASGDEAVTQDANTGGAQSTSADEGTEESLGEQGSGGSSGEKLALDTANWEAHEPFVPQNDAERLLMGYADFGLGEYILAEYRRLEDQVSNECAARVALFLDKCDQREESIRMASSRVFSATGEVPRELLAMAFPRRFEDAVEGSCRDFSQPEYLLYGLIRSESFFNETAVSTAGAKGLTQLMDATATDVAQKLKIADYDLSDGATNIRFGSFYLEELRRRLDSTILAILSYNAGISRVRSWVKSADLSFQTKALSHDLLLEALPFSETREYGRKVVSASAMYAYLYYGANPSDVVAEMMK